MYDDGVGVDNDEYNSDNNGLRTNKWVPAAPFSSDRSFLKVAFKCK